MVNVHKPINSVCYTPWLERFSFDDSPDYNAVYLAADQTFRREISRPKSGTRRVLSWAFRPLHLVHSFTLKMEAIFSATSEFL
jgi:hypothetical protein